MNVLITGGAGFLGSHICDFLVSEGCNVICLDNLITGNQNNIQALLGRPNFVFRQADVIKKFSTRQKLDYVLHFASPASPIDYLKFPVETLKSGALGTLNLLDLAKNKKAKFLLASTSEVYGDPLQNPQREDYWGNVNPVGPRSVYDEAKRYAEALTMSYHRYYGLDTRIVRIFNTYGPKMRDDDGRAIPAFMTQVLSNKPLTVFGDGSQTRSFCFVSDLVAGIWKLMLSDIIEPVNLGNPEEITISGLAQKILLLAGKSEPVIFKPLPQDDPKVRCPDINRAQRLLSWQPKITLDEGLKLTFQWYQRKASQNKPE
jgi:dTDP-glucose 4,6-dehydratase